MCGIFGYAGKRKVAARVVWEGLKRLEYRGYDSWGVAVATAGGIRVKKRVGKIGRSKVGELPGSDLGIGHTRWATHGGVSEANSHPQTDCGGRLAVVHNGIIENYEELKLRLVKTGHKFLSQTDTEVFAHLVEVYIGKMGLAGAVRKSFLEIRGLNAVAVMDAGQKNIVAVRNGSPLVLGFGEGENYVASDPAAIAQHTQRAVFLDDGEMAEISADGIRVSDVVTGREKKAQITSLQKSGTQEGKGGYRHFMMKEIEEQVSVLDRISRESGPEVKKLALLIDKSFGTYLIGCGTASYACLAGSYLFSEISGKHVNWCVGSEFGYQLDFLTPRSLVVALSQSGETMDTLEAVKKAKEKGAGISAMVNVAGSSLDRTADSRVGLGVGTERAVASTKAFTAKVAYLVLMAYILAGKEKQGRKVIQNAAVSVDRILTGEAVSVIKKMAEKLKNVQHMYVVGRGLSYAGSLEAALKIKEVSYIHAEGLAAGELKHGTLALVEKGIPCMVFLPNDETYGANLAGAMEMKARGATIIGVSYKNCEIFDYFVPVTDAREATLISNVVVGQLLAYYLAVARKLDPDMPRNLAKSVTVK
jgi:glucosamine--fructose-6-phosphate aminotransferase (isomerizing)